jgi:hypothetical protein
MIGESGGPDRDQAMREEQLTKLREQIDQSNLSDEAKKSLQGDVSTDPAFAPYLNAAGRGQLLLFEDTNKDGNARVVMVDQNYEVAHWALLNLPELQNEDKPRQLGATNDSYAERTTTGNLTEREILEVKKAYSKVDSKVIFDAYDQARLDEQNQKADKEGKDLHDRKEEAVVDSDVDVLDASGEIDPAKLAGLNRQAEAVAGDQGEK